MGLLNLDPAVADLPATLKDGGIAHDASYSLETIKAGRSWEQSVLGMFCEPSATVVGAPRTDLSADVRACEDVKPNYPGRSSHVGVLRLSRRPSTNL